MARTLGIFLGGSARLLCATLLAATVSSAQSSPPSPDKSSDLDARIASLSKSLERTQSELAESRTEIQKLRETLDEILKRIGTAPPTSTMAAAKQPEEAPLVSKVPGESKESETAQSSSDDLEILNSRIEELQQTKVESASKFHLKLSGIVLFNAFTTDHQVDNLDLPSVAAGGLPGFYGGGTGASLRQSILGLTGTGPKLFGANTAGDLQVDFYGGLPSGYNATTSGIAEIRLARIRFDWTNTSAVAGLDYPFFSPNLPTTYMSVAQPGFAAAGNLWAWVPQVRVEHRFTGALSRFKVEGGFLDPGSDVNYESNTSLRVPSPSEGSRQPTYAIRVSADSKSENHPATIGVSAVISPQQFLPGPVFTGWAGTLDWKFAPLPHTEISGQFFEGRGLDAFGGLPMSPVRPGDPVEYDIVTAPVLASLRAIGGWSQFKYTVNSRSEFNVAAGTGGRDSARLREASVTDSFLTTVPARNQMLFANYIFKPRSNIVLSVEYRRLRTYGILNVPSVATQLGLAIGYKF